MADLFVGKPLQNDTGLLRERWDQEGSARFDATGSGGNGTTSFTVRTVTSGKTFYVDTLVIAKANNGTEGNVTIKDNATAIIDVDFDTGVLYDTKIIYLKTPLAFSTSVKAAYADPGVFGSVSVTVVGWEEKA